MLTQIKLYYRQLNEFVIDTVGTATESICGL